MTSLKVNGELRTVEADPDKPLLWVLREDLGLTGTKFGCGIGACGACTVHVDGEPVRSCSLPVSAAAGADIITIEGLGASGGVANGTQHRVQRAWIDVQVPQCGYCQSGMIMAAAALLRRSPKPTDAEIDAAMTNLCRCGTYPRVRRAIRRLADKAS
jgi:isoquinoline 1-oxidoreductase alpha subunit